MREKTKTRLEVTAKICGALALLYFFICSLDLLSTGFQLLVGQTAGIRLITFVKMKRT